MKVHYYYLDLFRLLATLCVLFIHARCECFAIYGELNAESQNWFTFVFYSMTSFGKEGLIMLCLISGFLVGGRYSERMLQGAIDPKRFIKGRLVRIFPTLIVATLLTAIVNIIIGKGNSGINLLGNICGLQGVLVPDEGGTFWPMPYEIWGCVCLWGIMCADKCSKKIYICRRNSGHIY